MNKQTKQKNCSRTMKSKELMKETHNYQLQMNKKYNGFLQHQNDKEKLSLKVQQAEPKLERIIQKL